MAVFTSLVNVLLLASHSTATLLALFLIVVFLYAMMGLLDHVRGRMLARIGPGFQAELDDRVFATVLRQAEVPKLREKPAGALRDLAAIQSLLASPGTGAVFDLPWAPFYILIMFVFHAWLGWFALAGSVIVFLLAVLNQRPTQRPSVGENAASHRCRRAKGLYATSIPAQYGETRQRANTSSTPSRR